MEKFFPFFFFNTLKEGGDGQFFKIHFLINKSLIYLFRRNTMLLRKYYSNFPKRNSHGKILWLSNVLTMADFKGGRTAVRSSLKLLATTITITRVSIVAVTRQHICKLREQRHDDIVPLQKTHCQM